MKKINNQLTIYVVILDIKKRDKIKNTIKERLNTKVFLDSLLLFYNLDSINIEYPDIFSTIKNYCKNKNHTYDREIIIYDENDSSQTFDLPFYFVQEALCGIEELREETKCYI